MKNIKAVIIIIIGYASFSCQYNENKISRYLNQKEIAYEEICVQKGKEVWHYFTDSKYIENNQSKELFAKFFGDEILNENITKWYENIDKIENDTLKRRIEIWNNILTCAKVNFEPKVIGIQNDLEKKLANYPSDEYTDQEIETEIIKLVKLRNLKAKDLGYSNYAFMVLQNTGIDTMWFENLVQIIDSTTETRYKEFVAQISNNNHEPEYSILREYLIKENQLQFLNKVENQDKRLLLDKILYNIGIDLNTLPIQFTFNDLPPGIGGFGDCIKIPDDFKAVAMEKLDFRYVLHEIGHGLQWTNVTVDSPVLKGYEWCMGNIPGLYYEAMAEVIGEFSQKEYYLELSGSKKNEIDSLMQLKKELGALSLRYQLINSLFEIELYKNPDKSAADIKHDLFKKYLFVEKDFTSRPNLIALSYVSYPVYIQNYLIASMISWQIHEFLMKKYGQNYIVNPNVGEFLKSELWCNGELFDWQDRILKTCGNTLDIEGYLKNILF